MAGRHFIALALPAPAVDEIRLRQQRLCELLGRVARPVDPSQLHVTLAFLADRTAEEVPAIVEHVDQSFAGEHAYDLRSGELRRVGGGSVLALMLTGPGMPRLQEARSELEGRLLRDGLMPRERRDWHPHISVIRRSGRGPRLPLPSQRGQLERPIDIGASEVHLVHSQPAGNRHEHASVHVVRLA